ncbi:hypothetical protein BXA08_04165 [Campylobacter lari]|nr:hypothetical protein [Campylobacter lari]
MQEIKTIEEIILHKDDALAKTLLIKATKNDTEDHYIVDQKYLEEVLLSVDKIAVVLPKYDEGRLKEPNLGHWDIYRFKEKTKNSVVIKLKDRLHARTPLLDVQKERVVAIDFGTKSTVAGFLDENSQKQLIRIGSGNRGIENENDYENPTVIEFVNIEQFMQAYRFSKSRPFTSFNDISVSHVAFKNLNEAKNDDFYRFFSNLKQWAGNGKNKFRIKDKKDIVDLKDFTSCKKDDLNPIELYAYYIGRYINNMINGIHLNYILSFPVKYSLNVRNKIRESFERGIKKSIPYAVLTTPEYTKEFKVILGASEPAAYAISALQEYNFLKKVKGQGEPVFYGVFDFGGGTTDFDFGVLKTSTNKKHPFDIEHFGADGDEYLGGENLLELLVYELAKDNKAKFLEENISVTKPLNAPDFGASESIIKQSQEARANTVILKEAFRPLWEDVSKFADLEQPISLQTGAITKTETDNYEINNIYLFQNNGKTAQVSLSFNPHKYHDILFERINDGVKKFYIAFTRVVEKMQNFNDTLHIFLGGNASRSKLVDQAFKNLIKNVQDNVEYRLYPPLGTKEADEKIKELKGDDAVLEQDFSKKVTCKTGVVFGLLDGRKTNKRFNIISEVDLDEEAKFHFHIGIQSYDDTFEMVIDRDKVEVGIDKQPQQFLPYADDEEFELYYTKDARAETNELPLSDQGVFRKKLKLDKTYDEGHVVCIKFIGPNIIKHCVYKGDECIKEYEETKLN